MSSQPMKIPKKLHPGQTRAWRTKARYVAIIAGTGGGKTWYGPIWLYREIEAHPEGDFLVAAPTYQMLSRITQPEFRKLIDALWPGLWDIAYRERDRTLNLPAGGHVFFGSADNPITLEGVHVYAVWLDEAGQMKRMIWDVVTRRVGHKKGRILITTTPYNLGWLKLEVYDRWKAGDKDYDVISFPSIWNPTYPRDEYERAKRTLPQWKFAMFYKGKFTRASGLVYQELDQGVHIVDSSMHIPDSWPRYLGVDWGITAPTAVVWGALDPEDRLYVYRELYVTGLLPGESAAQVLALSGKEIIEEAFCDPEDPGAIETWKRLGINATKAENAILDGIIEVIGRLRTKTLHIFRGCYYVLDEAEQYKWKTIDEKIKDEPVHEYCHALDGLRYLVMGVRGKAGGSDIPPEEASHHVELPSHRSRWR